MLLLLIRNNTRFLQDLIIIRLHLIPRVPIPDNIASDMVVINDVLGGSVNGPL